MKTPLLAILVLLPVVALAETSPTATKPVTTSPTTAKPAATSTAKPSPAAASPTAPGANPNIPDPTEELKVMTERLQLSPSQQAAIKPILVEEFNQRKAIEENKSLGAPQKRDESFAVHRAALQKIKAVFTPAQMALIEAGMNNPGPSPTNTKSTGAK
jgi:hypothetical protein